MRVAEPEDDFEAGPSDEELEEEAGASSGSGSDEEPDAAGSSAEEDEQDEDFGSGAWDLCRCGVGLREAQLQGSCRRRAVALPPSAPAAGADCTSAARANPCR